MDLLDFEGQSLYFERALPQTAARLLDDAAQDYGSDGAELSLLKAGLFAPDHLTVLVAQYRYYYFQHRLEEARMVAERCLKVVGEGLGFPEDWSRIDQAYLSRAVLKSMGMVRFYLLALKADGYVCLRLGREQEGVARLRKVVQLDQADRLGAKALLEIVEDRVYGRASAVNA